MKKLFYPMAIVVFGISSCQKSVDELPKTGFLSASEFTRSLLPEAVIVEANTDTTIEVVFDEASFKMYRIDWEPEHRSKPIRIEARFYNRAIDMMCGSLPTVSNDELLSSEGSFEIKFVIDNQRVSPRRIRTWFKGETAYSQTMNLFAGVNTPAGFNWLEMVVNSDQNGSPSNVPWGTFFPTESTSGFGYSGTLNLVSDFFDLNDGLIFINCDDFPNVPTARTTVQFDIQNLPDSISGEIVGGLYFPDLNGFMPLQAPQSIEDLPHTWNVPTTLSCKAIAIAVSNETIYYSIEDIVTEEGQVVVLEMQPTSEAQLAGVLDNL